MRIEDAALRSAGCTFAFIVPEPSKDILARSPGLAVRAGRSVSLPPDATLVTLSARIICAAVSAPLVLELDCVRLRCRCCSASCCCCWSPVKAETVDDREKVTVERGVMAEDLPEPESERSRGKSWRSVFETVWGVRAVVGILGLESGKGPRTVLDPAVVGRRLLFAAAGVCV